MPPIPDTTTPAVRPATAGDVATIAATFADAFADDPVMRWFVGPRGDVSRRLEPTFRAIAAAAMRKPAPEAFLSDDGGSAAIWRQADDWRYSPGELLRLLPANLRSFRLRTVRVLRALTIVEKAHLAEPHIYLQVLGTRTDRQGSGLGSQVLAPMLERVDREGMVIYTESSNPANLSFYFRHGFVQLGTIDLPGGPSLYPIRRDPR